MIQMITVIFLCRSEKRQVISDEDLIPKIFEDVELKNLLNFDKLPVICEKISEKIIKKQESDDIKNDIANAQNNSLKETSKTQKLSSQKNSDAIREEVKSCIYKAYEYFLLNVGDQINFEDPRIVSLYKLLARIKIYKQTTTTFLRILFSKHIHELGEEAWKNIKNYKFQSKIFGTKTICLALLKIVSSSKEIENHNMNHVKNFLFQSCFEAFKSHSLKNLTDETNFDENFFKAINDFCLDIEKESNEIFNGLSELKIPIMELFYRELLFSILKIQNPEEGILIPDCFALWIQEIEDKHGQSLRIEFYNYLEKILTGLGRNKFYLRKTKESIKFFVNTVIKKEMKDSFMSRTIQKLLNNLVYKVLDDENFDLFSVLLTDEEKKEILLKKISQLQINREDLAFYDTFVNVLETVEILFLILTMFLLMSFFTNNKDVGFEEEVQNKDNQTDATANAFIEKLTPEQRKKILRNYFIITFLCFIFSYFLLFYIKKEEKEVNHSYEEYYRIN